MAHADELIQPILQIATGEARRRRIPPRRYSELELRRRLDLAHDQIQGLYAEGLARHRITLATVLRDHAQVMEDGRIAIDPSALQRLLDEAKNASSVEMIHVLLRVMFETGDIEPNAEPSPYPRSR